MRQMLKKGRAGGMVILFCLAIHTSPLPVSSAVEFGENNRPGFPVDAALLVLAAGALYLRHPSGQPAHHTRSGEML